MAYFTQVYKIEKYIFSLIGQVYAIASQIVYYYKF